MKESKKQIARGPASAGPLVITTTMDCTAQLKLRPFQL
jgi:hypothetical protein